MSSRGTAGDRECTVGTWIGATVGRGGEQGELRAKKINDLERYCDFEGACLGAVDVGPLLTQQLPHPRVQLVQVQRALREGGASP